MAPFGQLADTPGTPYPKTLIEFARMFPDEHACANYLLRLRWPGGNLLFRQV